LSVLHPALESHPGHAIWKRDFAGVSGLFSIVLKPLPPRHAGVPHRGRSLLRALAIGFYGEPLTTRSP
jgi:cystathionine beta-lyase/cystathionine gamma-synthase